MCLLLFAPLFLWSGKANAPQRRAIPLDDVDQFPLSVIPLLVPPLLSLEESLGRKKVRLIDLRTTNFLLTPIPRRNGAGIMELKPGALAMEILLLELLLCCSLTVIRGE